MNPDSPADVARATLKILEDVLKTEGLEKLTPAQLEQFAQRCAYWLQVASRINRERKRPPPTRLRPTPK